MKTYVLGTHWNRLVETLPMNTTTNIFKQEITNLATFFGLKKKDKNPKKLLGCNLEGNQNQLKNTHQH